MPTLQSKDQPRPFGAGEPADESSDGSHELQGLVLRGSVWLCLFVMFLSRISTYVVDLDIYHEMALIRESIALGHIPTVDRFAYTPTLAYSVHHEWGSGAIAYFAATWFGAAGLLLLKYSLAAVLAWLCIAIARARNTDFLPAFGVLAPVGILFAGNAFSPVRAHLYSLVFVACLLYFLERDRQGGRRWIAFWLPLYLVWLNLHGGFVMGIVLVGMYWVEQLFRGKRSWHLPILAAAMVALIVVNPYGTHCFTYLWHALKMSRPEIGEWGTVWASFPSFNSVMFFLSLVPLLYAVREIGFRSMPGLAIICALALEGALHGRILPFYAVAWTCYLPGYILATPCGPRLRTLFERPPMIFQMAWIVAFIFFLNVTITFRPWILEVPGQGKAEQAVYPVGAVEYLSQRQFHGNAMVPFEYGAYVSWKLYPAVRVSIDSRYEVAYPDWWVDEILRFYRAQPGWKQTLAGASDRRGDGA